MIEAFGFGQKKRKKEIKVYDLGNLKDEDCEDEEAVPEQLLGRLELVKHESVNEVQEQLNLLNKGP